MKQDPAPPFFDTPKGRKHFRRWVYIGLGALLTIDLMAWFGFERHGHFAWEILPFFNAVFGFSACTVLICIARLWRWIVQKKEGYYD